MEQKIQSRTQPKVQLVMRELIVQSTQASRVFEKLGRALECLPQDRDFK